MAIQVVLDTECYKNYWLLMCKQVESGKVIYFHMDSNGFINTKALKKFLQDHRYEFITFNGNGYDIPMIRHALWGATTEQLKKASDALIVGGVTSWNFSNEFACEPLRINHIDLIEIPAGQCSLKAYGGRLHMPKLQDLPIDPDAILSPNDMIELRDYCVNDLDTTIGLAEYLKPQINIRRDMSKQYGLDLRSKSDAQIAEAVIKSEVQKLSGKVLPKVKNDAAQTFYFDAPKYIKFGSDLLKNVLEIVTTVPFSVRETGKIDMDEQLENLKITIGGSTYQMGMGGLHSTESKVNYQADEEFVIRDQDVLAYYPNLILNTGLFPNAMGEHFATVFKSIVDRRIAAKKIKDKVTDSTLKIVINGTFGKLGSIYSAMYAPKLMIQTTITGQLSLLMLIERLEELRISVVSANTDGIVIRCPVALEQVLIDTTAKWEQRCKLTMEATNYSSIYSRDINNYIAVKLEGGVKTKGTYAEAGIAKNPENDICTDAVVAYLTSNVAIDETLRTCTDIRKFLTLRQVTGGAEKDGKYLGKVVRFYYSTEVTGTIQYKKNGNKVPKSTNARPCMNIPDKLPSDIDYVKYARICRDMLRDLAVLPQPEKLPRKNSKAWKELRDSGQIVEFEGEWEWHDL